VRAVLADKVGQAKTAYSEKAPPAVQQWVEHARAVVAEKAPVVQQQVSKAVSDATPVVQVSKAVSDATPVVQQQVAKARSVLAEKAPPVERTLREKPGVVAAVAVALVALLIFSSPQEEVSGRGGTRQRQAQRG
jgi:DNA-binding transcriptional regulator YdaS (Cro superfamily)